jgi:hypothetical protein
MQARVAPHVAMPFVTAAQSAFVQQPAFGTHAPSAHFL